LPLYIYYATHYATDYVVVFICLLLLIVCCFHFSEADNLAFNDSENETIKTIHKKTKKKKVTELIEE